MSKQLPPPISSGHIVKRVDKGKGRKEWVCENPPNPAPTPDNRLDVGYLYDIVTGERYPAPGPDEESQILRPGSGKTDADALNNGSLTPGVSYTTALRALKFHDAGKTLEFYRLWWPTSLPKTLRSWTRSGWSDYEYHSKQEKSRGGKHRNAGKPQRRRNQQPRRRT